MTMERRRSRAAAADAAGAAGEDCQHQHQLLRRRSIRCRTSSGHHRPLVVLATAVVAACAVLPLGIVEATDRPIWAILSQPNRVTSSSDAPPAFSSFPEDWAFINADYVKWIEAAGARAVPLHYDAPAAETDALLQQVNGVIFPGGNDIIEPGSPYYTAARHVFERVLAMNDAGDHFPLHGTCLGLELLAELATERAFPPPPGPGPTNDSAAAAAAAAAVLTRVDAENISLSLRFHTPDPARASTLYSLLSPEEVAALSRRNLTENFHHFGVTLDTWRHTPALPQFFRLISDSSDRAGVPFASTIEARDYPVFATQWHPERSLFEWGPTEDINHSPAAVRIVQLIADALVRTSRPSRHRFPSPEAEAAASIYNSQVIYRERVSTPQLYIFPPWNGTTTTTAVESSAWRLRGSNGRSGSVMAPA